MYLTAPACPNLERKQSEGPTVETRTLVHPKHNYAGETIFVGDDFYADRFPCNLLIKE